jgi:hypothetical protein
MSRRYYSLWHPDLFISESGGRGARGRRRPRGHQGETHHACMQRAAGHDSSPILRHQPTTSPPRKLCLPLPAGIRTPVRSPSRRLWHARRPACLPAPPRRQRWAPTRAGVNSIQALADECRVQRAAGGPYRPGNSSTWVPYACAPHLLSLSELRRYDMIAPGRRLVRWCCWRGVVWSFGVMHAPYTFLSDKCACMHCGRLDRVKMKTHQLA